ncbi:MAG: TIGR02147 family protein [Proteobacteria bacterium]|nr:TIGR02147 family protein [Pseudomonadota bacterium]
MKNSTSTNSTDFRHILKQHLLQRVTRNPKYSQGAFARDLGLKSNRLSEILSGKQGISPQVALDLAKKLELNQSETEQFCHLVAARHGRSQALKDSSRSALASHNIPEKSQTRNFDTSILSKWYSIVILECIRITKQIAPIKWYASELGVSEAAVKLCLDNLRALGLFVKDDNGHIWADQLNIESPVPSANIKQFHLAAMDLAAKAIFSVDMSEREYQSMVIPMEAHRVTEFKEKLRNLVHEFADAADAQTRATSVYMLSAQMFPIIQLAQSSSTTRTNKIKEKLLKSPKPRTTKH